MPVTRSGQHAGPKTLSKAPGKTLFGELAELGLLVALKQGNGRDGNSVNHCRLCGGCSARRQTHETSLSSCCNAGKRRSGVLGNPLLRRIQTDRVPGCHGNSGGCGYLCGRARYATRHKQGCLSVVWSFDTNGRFAFQKHSDVPCYPNCGSIQIASARPNPPTPGRIRRLKRPIPCHDDWREGRAAIDVPGVSMAWTSFRNAR